MLYPSYINLNTPRTHLSDVSELIDDFRHFVVLGVDGRRPIEFRVVHLCAQQWADDVVRVSADDINHEFIITDRHRRCAR